MSASIKFQKYLFQQQIGIRRAARHKMFRQMQERGQRVRREVVAAAALQHVGDDQEPTALQHVLLHRAAGLHQGAHEAEEFRAGGKFTCKRRIKTEQ